ncbi:MAG: hypothetical protein HYX72_01180 [Acidobacteria bacterium]|nr:hypothetical protein [Acidobacteriota bacterium]
MAEERGSSAGDRLRPSRARHSASYDEEMLPTIALIHVPHAKIPNLFQCCYEYVDPWDWSRQTELVETGRWFFGPAKDEP